MTRSPRSWLVEAALAVVAVLTGAMFVLGSLGDGAPLVIEALAGLLSTAGLVLLRRSHPVALALLLLPAGLLLGMPMGAFPVALFAVALHRGARPAVALAGSNSVAVAVVYFLAFGSTRTYYESVAFLILLHVSLVAVALLVRSHRLLVRSWSDRARQAEEGQRLRVEQARLAERESVAREMHDVLAHRISLLALHAGALEVRHDAPPAERDAAGVIRRSAHEALQDLRTVIRMLRTPADAHPQPTLTDLPALADRARSAGIDVHLTLAPAEEVPVAVGRHAYRIVQEALTNAHLHAPGRPVTVTVTDQPGREVAVEVDNPLDRPSESLRPRRPAGPSEPPEFSMATAPSQVPASESPGSAASGTRTSARWSAGRPGTGGADGAARSPHVPEAGADIGTEGGTGLAALAERVRLIGGRFEHGPTANHHFRVRAWLPYGSDAPEARTSSPA